MVNLAVLAILVTSLSLLGCTVDKSGQALSFPSKELLPIPGSGGGGSGAPPTIQLITSILIGYSTFGVASGLESDNIVFDGTFFVVPAGTATNTINFSIINAASFSYTSSYQATATGVAKIYAATSNGAGRVYVIWRDGSGTKYLSGWPTINPTTPTSSFTFNLATYGCDSGSDFQIAYLAGTFYGACTDGGAYLLRLFSFDSNGNVLSSLTQSWPTSQRGGVLGLTILNGNLLVATGYYANASFTKYSTTFQLVSALEQAINLLTYYTVRSLASDGTYLYVGNGYEACRSTACYRFSKITKGSL